MRKFGFSFKFGVANTGKIEQFGYISHAVPKFVDDKLCKETEDFLVILDGVIINKRDLSRKYKKENWYEALLAMYLQNGDTFFSDFRGTFAGVLLDKKAQKVVAFSDQIGSKFLFYSRVNNEIIISTMMDDVYSFRKEKQVKNSLSIENAYLLLSYGFMIDERTLCEDIKKVKPGCYLTIIDGIIKEKQFYYLDNTPNRTLSENEWIERIDETFRKAVKEQFEKDKEYGYRHLVALSAGLDSRMTCWVAHDMGYTDQLNYTFSQSNYYDETIPETITRDLKHEWLFKSLDNGLWLYNLDDITRLTGGNVLYYGLAHAYSMFSKMNFEEYGLIHTGQLGDVILGTFYGSADENAQFKWGDGAYSKTMLSRIQDLPHSNYANQEIAKFYMRGFTGTNNGNMAEYAFTESYSPFYNLDFFELALSIPVEYRYRHRIYKKWILNKYPKAADYIWENLGSKITRTLGIISIGGKSYKIEKIPEKAIRKLFPNLLKPDTQSMNPLSYYLSTNENLSSFIDSFVPYADIITDAELKSDVLGLSKSSNGIERIEAASLLSALKIYF